MQVLETSADGLKREYTITVPASELEERISRRLDELGHTIRLPGFRPGKVPMQLLRRRYGPAVRGEVLESAVQDGSAEAVREHNLRPALPPRVSIVSAEEGADLEYRMSVEVLPEMPPPSFSDLGLERLVAEVPDEDIDKAVERFAEQQRKTQPVDRPAASGDITVVDMVGRIGDSEIPGSRGEGRPIELGAGGLLPGFEDQLTGAAAGEQRTVNITFPEDYGNRELAGKEAVFEVTVKEIRQKEPVAIDDALAQAAGLDSLAELRQEIREGMRRDYDMMTRQRLKRALLDKLAERYDFPVPPGMLDIEFKAIWNQYQTEKAQREAAANTAEAGEPTGSPQQAAAEPAAGSAAEGAAAEGAAAPAAEAAVGEAGVGEAAPGEPGSARPGEDRAAGPDQAEEEQTRAEYRRIAERRVRLGLLLAEVGRSNNITVTQEELNQALAREARRHRGYERQALDYYRKNPEAVANLRAPIFEDKVVDFILELAKVEERRVTPQELLAFPNGEADDTAPA